MARPALQNGAPWLEVGAWVEVKSDAGWLLCRVHVASTEREKYLGYAHVEIPGSGLTRCVAPWNYGEQWRLPSAPDAQAVGL
jgi:hypothetical protein